MARRAPVESFISRHYYIQQSLRFFSIGKYGGGKINEKGMRK